MKTRNFIPTLILSLTGLFTITSCGFYYNESLLPPIIPGESESESEENESVTSSDSDSPFRNLNRIEVVDTTIYSIGQIYSTDKQISLIGYYSDGTNEPLAPSFVESFHVAKMTTTPIGFNKNINHSAKDRFTYPGTYEVKAQINHEYIAYYSITVEEGLSDNKISVKGIDVKLDNITFSKGEIIDDTISADITVHFNNDGKQYIKYNKDTKNLYPQIGLKLVTDENDQNRISNPLLPSVNYRLIISISGYSYTKDIFVKPGYEKLTEMSFVTSDFDENVIKSTGEAKVLVVPVYFTTFDNPFTNDDDVFVEDLRQYLDEVSEEKLISSLSILYNYYFMDSEAVIPSIHTFYEKSSYGLFHLNGAFAQPRYKDLINYNFLDILNDSSNQALHNFLQNTLDYVVEDIKINGVYPEDEEFDFADYDLNSDGIIDNVHFITNLDHLKIDENNPFAPHSGHANTTSQNGNFDLGRYYISTLKNMTDVEIALESGEIGILDATKEIGKSMGLKEYDNKTSSTHDINYVGHAEMMSTCLMDFSSFSKMANGWMEPYVIDGSADSVELTIRSFETFGDCIVVPADYSTYNGSAYDEYFLVELFTNEGNNSNFLEIYNLVAPEGIATFDENSAGVRIHHVDARLVKDNGNGTYTPSDYTKGANGKWIMPINNSYNYSDYGVEAVYDEWADFKLITTIQKGKTNTFASGSRTFLTPDDLFYAGDTFTFDEYRHFLTKSGASIIAMDNGETFPYEIEIVSVSPQEARIKFSK